MSEQQPSTPAQPQQQQPQTQPQQAPQSQSPQPLAQAQPAWYPQAIAQQAVAQQMLLLRTPPTTDTCYVTGFHDPTTQQALLMFFSQHGARVKMDASQVPSISFVGSGADIAAYITFETPQDAMNACELNHASFEDTQLTISPVILTQRVAPGFPSQASIFGAAGALQGSQAAQLAAQQARMMGMTGFENYGANPYAMAARHFAAQNTGSPFGGRSYVPRSGDWVCPGCRNCNYASRTACNKCKSPRPAVIQPPPGVDQVMEALARARISNKPGETMSGATGPRRQADHQLREGDWICPQCLNHNYAHREQCNRCKAPKPADVAANNAQLKEAYEAHQAQTASSRKIRDGDWICALCRNHNYSHRLQCNRCGVARQGNDIPANALLNSRDGTMNPDAAALLAASPLRGAPAGLAGILNPAAVALLTSAGLVSSVLPQPGAMGARGSPAAAQLAQVMAIPPALLPAAMQASAAAAGGLPQQPGVNAPTMRPGDWICPKCSNHNFRQRLACNRCQLPRPEGI